MVRMTCPALPDNGPIFVPKSVVEGHERMGWVVDESTENKTAAEATNTTEPTPAPDPAAVTRRRDSTTAAAKE